MHLSPACDLENRDAFLLAQEQPPTSRSWKRGHVWNVEPRHTHFAADEAVGAAADDLQGGSSLDADGSVKSATDVVTHSKRSKA